ncbi:MAG: 50S ribosomal protein L29 [Deinococcales bacterium]
MKRSESLKAFREMDVAGLEKAVASRKQELMNLRIQKVISTLPNNTRLNTLRKEIAQLLTIATEKKNAGLATKKVK